ncbi:MAG: N-acetylglutaminylglutamine synthetase [Rhodospirillaceae bacterium]
MTASQKKSGTQRRRKPVPRVRQQNLLPIAAVNQVGDPDAFVECGWGRLFFAPTFDQSGVLADMLRAEEPNARDIAFHVADPQVLISHAPQDIFLDPSKTYRMWLNRYKPRRTPIRGFFIRRLRNRADAEAVNNIYTKCSMVQVPNAFLQNNRASRTRIYLVAEDEKTGRIVGTVTGIDHHRAFSDPEKGSSLWCLAVDPDTPFPGIGEALVRYLIEFFQARGRTYMDLSVIHDNASAINLYSKLGMEELPLFCVKKRNVINEKLFIGDSADSRLNIYARIITIEARRRGIQVGVEDEDQGLFALTLGGRTIHCRESLSDLTSAVALSRCDDKALTSRLLRRAEIAVPAQMETADPEENEAFLNTHKRVVVKPAEGEQGAGISVDIRTASELVIAIDAAAAVGDTVLIEEYREGLDLRIIVIDHKVVAAAVRRPAEVIGNGTATVAQLIESTSRRRAAASGGESHIPMDRETERCVNQAGHDMDTVLPAGTKLAVRKTANLHTGGTLHDVTDILHPQLAEAAIKASQILRIPVVGMDLIVTSPDQPDYMVIEANERPGLANHEPQPTVERFIDLLFPQTKRQPHDSQAQ